MSDVDQIIRQALTASVAELDRRAWWGKEREAVSVFVMGFLQQHIDPTRIGIEVLVPQLRQPHRKAEVCKDPVMWAAQFDNVFIAPRKGHRLPVAVMEWKCHQREYDKADVEWLRRFTTAHPTCVGYAVTLYQDEGRWKVTCCVVRGAEVRPL